MRKVEARVLASCSDCPFHDVIESDTVTTMENGSEQTFKPGWFCLHKARRGYIAFASAVPEDRRFRDYLEEQCGEPFPGDCPLPKVRPIKAGTGQRDVDLT